MGTNSTTHRNSSGETKLPIRGVPRPNYRADRVSYVLHPMGSVSKIEELKTDPSNPSAPTKSTMLELFSSGDLPLGRLFMHRKLDSAMVAFLDCLRQLGDFAEAHDANLKLPYK